MKYPLGVKSRIRLLVCVQLRNTYITFGLKLSASLVEDRPTMGFWRRATNIYLGEYRFRLRGSVWTSGVLLRGDVSQRGGVTWGVAHWWTDSSCLQRWTLNQHQRSSEVTYGLFRQVGFPDADKKKHDAEKLLGSRKVTALWKNCAIKKFIIFTPRQTFRVMKSRGMKRVRLVARIQANIRFWWRNLK